MGILDAPTIWSKLPGRPAYYVDDYGADPTGATFSDTAVAVARAAMGTKKGILVFGAGTYKLANGIDPFKAGQSVEGQGSGATIIDFRGSSSGAFTWREASVALASPQGSASFKGVTVYGWNAGNNAWGLRYGDIGQFIVRDVYIVGFGGTGSKGLWGDNRYSWSERCQIQAWVEKCTECVVFENNTGYDVDTSGSFDYSSYDLVVQADVGQHGVVIRKGSVAVASGNPGTQFSGVDMKVRGNFKTHASANSGVAFAVGVEGDSTDHTEFIGTLDIGVENSGGLAVSHKDINVAPNAVVNACGNLNFAGASTWVAGSANEFTVAFSGRINTKSLGAITGNQSLRTIGSVTGSRLRNTYASTTLTWYMDTGNVGSYQLPNGASSVYLRRDGLQSTSPQQAGVYTIRVQQPSSGAAATVSDWTSGTSITADGTIVWVSGHPPILATANDAVDIIQFFTNDHLTFYGVHLNAPPAVPDRLASGFLTIPRWATNTTSLSLGGSGSLHLTYFDADKTAVVTTVGARSGGTAAGATPTVARIGLYSVAANGDLTLIASTANDTALFSAANTNYSKSFSASATVTRGQRLAVGVLVVSGATMPTLVGNSGNAGSSELAIAPRLCGLVTGQTDLPSSVAAGSVSNSGSSQA